MTGGSLIIFLEDPGAAGFAKPVLLALQNRGENLVLMAAPSICAFLAEGDLKPQAVPTSERPPLPAGRLLITGTSTNPDSAGLCWIDEARAKNIPSLGLVDFAANADKRFKGRGQDPFHHRPDRLLAVDGQTRDAFVALGFPSDKITVTGNPHFDVVATRASTVAADEYVRSRRLLGWPEGRQVALFLSEPQVRPGFAVYNRTGDYYFQGRGNRHGRSEILMEEFLDATGSLQETAWRIIRFHPREDRALYGDLISEFDAVDDSADGFSSLLAADVICGMSTSKLVDSAILRRPTLSLVACPDEETWLPQDPRGAVVKARSRQALHGFMRNPQPPAPASDTDHFSATANVIAAIDEILSAN